MYSKKIFFRFGQPDLLNNNDNLLRDLLSTRIKGVDENSRNILNLNNPLSGQLVQPMFPTIPPDELSRRSSLLSFFQDTANDQEEVPTILNEISQMPPTYPSNTPSIVTAENADSGVYSPSSSDVVKRERKQKSSVSRNISWRMKENVTEEDYDIEQAMISTMAAIETTV